MRRNIRFTLWVNSMNSQSFQMWFTHLMEGMDDYHLDNCQQSSSWLWLHVHILLKETWYLYCLNNNGLKIKIFWYSEYMNIDKIWQRLIFKFPNLMPWSLSTPQNHESLRMMNEKPYHNKCKSKLEMRNQNNTKKSIKTGKKTLKQYRCKWRCFCDSIILFLLHVSRTFFRCLYLFLLLFFFKL